MSGRGPIRITLDPGHGGSDAGGAPGAPGVSEKAVNLAVARRLAERLRGAGHEVQLTRERDEAVPLPRRVEQARAFRADLFVSIHHNATAWGDRELNRSEAYYQVGREETGAERLARLLAEELGRAMGLAGLALPAYSYYVLRENEGVAVIGEASHLSHPEEARRLARPERIESEVEGYFRAVQRYLGEEGLPPPVRSAPVWEEAAKPPARPSRRLFHGVLEGKRILLDAEGGEPGASEPVGYAAATLAVAGELRGILRRLGADARCARRAGEEVDAAERVRRSYAFAPDTTITLSFDRKPCPLAVRDGSSRAYARWTAGQRLAQHLAEWASRILGTPASEALAGSDWLAMHGTPSFAACRLSYMDWEAHAGMRPDPLRCALAGLYGLVAFFLSEELETGARPTGRLEIGETGGAVCVEGVLPLIPTRAGGLAAYLLEPGEYRLVGGGQSVARVSADPGMA